MQSIRRSLSFAGLSLMAMALTFAACTDDGRSPVGPPEPPVIAPPTSGGPREGVAVQCRATIATREVVCGNPQPSAGEARAFAVTIGGQHQYVELISSNIVLTDNPVTPEADSIFGFDVRIQNILRQPIDGRRQKMGTSDPVGSAPDPDGIRVFFTSLIGQGAAATVHNPDGLGTFTTGNQEYFQYDAVLDSGAVSSPKQWQILLHEGATSFDFLLLVHTPIPFREGWIDLTPNVFGLAPGETQTLAANIRSFVGNVEPAKLIHSWSTSDPNVATVDATGTVTAVGVGTAKITASTASGRQTGSATVTVSNAPAAADTTIDAISNVTIPAAGLNARITDMDGGARHVVADSLRTAKGGIAWMKADGSFEYLSKSGFVGQDTIHYKVTDDVTRRDAKVIVNVAASKYWYVKQGASGDGRDRAPFGSFASAADSADAGDVILVLNGTSDINGPVMLEAGQSLIGQGITTPITEPVNGANVTVLASGIAPTITRTDGAGAAVVVTSNNTIRGLGITASNGPAITGSSFGTLTVSQTRVNPAGPALHLTDGNLDVVVDSLSSTGSAAQGLFLSGVTGSLTATRGVLRNSTGTAFAVTGGTANVTFNGTIVNPAGLAVSIANRTGGDIVLADSITGNGDGISLTGNAGGTVTFGGVLALTRKGIVAQNNTGGTFAFTGTGTKTIALDSTTYNAVTLATNTGASFVFGGGSLAISTASGTGFSATGGGTVSVTGPGNTISTKTGTAVALDGVNTTSAAGNGVVFATVNTDAATTGISINAITGAGFRVTGTGSASSGGSIKATGNGILLTSVSAPVKLDSLGVITTGAAAAISASSATDVTVTGVVVSATGGPALSLVGSTLNGTFLNLSSTGSASSAVILNNAAGAFMAADGELSGAASGPTIAVIGGSVDFIDFGTVSQAANAALLSVTAGHTGDLNFNDAVTATAGTGLQFADADGGYLFNGATTLAGGDAGVDVTGGSDGTFEFAATTSITNPTGVALNVAGGTPGVVYAGTISTNASRPVVVDGITADSVAVSGNITSTGNGILVQNNAAAAKVAFTGAKSLTTGANPGVSILTNASGVRFGGGNLNITTAGAIGFQVQGGGTVEVQGLNNTISTTGAVAASIQNASSGTNGITFRTVSASGAANAIVLNTLTGAGFQVTGDGTPNSGGTLSATNTAVMITAADSVHLKRVVVNAPAGVNATTFGGLRLDSATVTSTAGAALNLTTGRFHTSDLALLAANGAALATNGVAVAGTLDSLSANITTAGTAVSLVNSTGTLAANNGTITVSGAGSTAVSVNGGSAGLVFGGSATQDANAPLLAVAGGHTGTLVFNTGTLNANNGTGLQLTDGDGTYSFAGTLDLSGGDAGIDIAALSSGTMNVTPAGAHTASIVSPTGAAIAIAGGSGDLTFNGNVTQATAAQPLLSVAGSHTGDVSFPTGTLTATNGTGLQFNDADGTYAFNGTTTLSNSVVGADAGIDVIGGSGGTFTFNANSAVTNPASQAINIQNGAGTLAFTYSGSLTKNNNAATGILVQNNAGGSIAFNGVAKTKTLSTGTANAVSLLNNGSTSIQFAGGGLNITTTSGNGFHATGGGTVQVTGAENTVAAAGGVAVNIQNTSLGAGGVAFRSVNAVGGANGIVLSNTGNLGGFTVTGDGASNAANTTRGRTTSGASGAIVLGSGGTISGTSGSGISLANTNTVVLRNMIVQNNSGDGITAATVSGLTVDNTRITGHASDHGILGTSLNGLTLTHSEVESNATTDGAVEAADIWNVRLVDFAGTGVIQNSRLRQAEETVLGVVNDAGTGTLTITNTNITDAGTTAGNGVQITARGSSNLTVTMQNDSINRTKSRGVTAVADASATLAVNVSGSKFRDNFAGLEVATTSLGATTYNLVGNDFQWHESVPININRGSLGATPVTGSFRGTVENNTIGTAGQLGSGSSTANAGAPGGRGQGGAGIRLATNGQGGDTRIRIKGNVVREVINLGVNVIGRDGAHGLSVIYENNDVELPNHNLVSHATDIQAGASPTDQVSMCLDARANRSISPFSNGLRVRTNSGVSVTTNNQVALAQWDGVTAVNTFLANQNPSLGDNVSTTTSGGPFTAAAACSAP